MQGPSVGHIIAALAFVACNRTAEPVPRVTAPAGGNVTDKSHLSAAEATSNATAPCVRPLASPAPPAAPPAGAKCPPDSDPSSPALSTARIEFPDAPGHPALQIELARTPREAERGLMYRRAMPEDHGMLFPFSGAAREHTFWMHNTCISLDMMFIDASGVIAGILENIPTLNDEPRSIGCPSSDVLEVNGGWSRRHGIEPGQRVSLPPTN